MLLHVVGVSQLLQELFKLAWHSWKLEGTKLLHVRNHTLLQLRVCFSQRKNGVAELTCEWRLLVSYFKCALFIFEVVTMALLWLFLAE